MNEHHEIIASAHREIEEENRRKAIEAEKARLRAIGKQPWWHRLLPFTITITRRKA